MKEYILFFRLDILTKKSQPTPKEMKNYMQQWEQWISAIEEKNQLADGGHHLQYSGKLIRPSHKITNEPYSANKESIAGYLIILARDMDDAVSIAEKCPILLGGDKNSVEIRETASPQ
jgi:hypothetical protein